MKKTFALTLAFLLCASQNAWAAWTFEKLGRPLKPKAVPIWAVTQKAAGGHVAWGAVESPERKGIVGVDVETGKSTWVDLAKWRYGHIRFTRAANNHLYLYTGNPARFFKYDPVAGKLTDLGAPAKPASYFMRTGVGPDGRFYVGSYPKTHVAWVDPATDQVGTLGAMATDPRNKYIVQTTISDANVVYTTVGLHHAELWAYDTRTKQKKQILPAGPFDKLQVVKIHLGADGRVYGAGARKRFVCKPDGIEMIAKGAPRRADTAMRQAGDWLATQISPDGELLLTNLKTKVARKVKTDARGVAVKIYCVACEHEGRIYGGGFQPANVFRFDPAAGAMHDLGRQTAGTIQVYDILSHPKGLFLSSYVGAHQDFYDTKTGKRQYITGLYRPHQQERGVQLVLGPDGMIYIPSRPVKGHLGGALSRINPKDFGVTCWRHVVRDQSLNSVAAVPATGEMFCTTTTYGGSGSVPTEKEALVFLWDCAAERISWRGKPISGETSYGKAVAADNGIVYVHSRQRYFAFDPVKRQVVHMGQMPVKRVRYLCIADRPAGPKRLIYGLGDDAVFAIDPSDHSARIVARHASINKAQGLCVTKDGTLYYGAGADLWRAKLKP